jgi:hypothetical protein
MQRRKGAKKKSKARGIREMGGDKGDKRTSVRISDSSQYLLISTSPFFLHF